MRYLIVKVKIKIYSMPITQHIFFATFYAYVRNSCMFIQFIVKNKFSLHFLKHRPNYDSKKLCF